MAASSHRRLVWYLYPSHVLIALAALLAVSWLAGSSVRGFYLQQVELDLEARAVLLHGKVAELVRAAQLESLQSYCREAGRASGTRLTVVAPSGLVLADSEQEPAAMENHGGRPEIIAALAGRSGGDRRFSSSVQYDTMYVAIPLMQEGQVVGVLRTAIALTAVNEALAEILRQIALSGLLIALLVIMLAWLVARHLSRPLEEMKAGAERFAAGELSGGITEDGPEEVVALARAMNRMAGQLDRRLRTIERQRGQLQTVFCSMVDGVITVDGPERVVEINQAAADLLGVQPERTKGKNIEVAIRNSALKQLIRQTLTGGEPVESDLTLLGPQGREHFCRVQGNRLADLDDRGHGAVVVISDLTRLRRLESLRRDFVANVSHELKTPITSIEGFAETLLDGALEEPEGARRFTGIILQQSRRLHAIVEDLLTLSRIEQEDRRREIPLQELPLLETLQAAVQVCRERAAAREMALALHGPEKLRAWINPALLEQALVNLIDNAIKYSPPGRPITIEARSGEGEIMIMVRDRGPGIPAAALPRLFERFYRVDKARSTRMGGTGLGLAIVKHIVQAHRGRVEVSSEPGQGTVFTIYLPDSADTP
ncbi:ATP-binding protein [Desulfurivibrio sp. D14AmB]|uniref:ATP-binding protein n=1 Tax=Desulfurivibrio sp. D14AmB TaxID=3374370 RepID=UPI00376F12B4